MQGTPVCPLLNLGNEALSVTLPPLFTTLIPGHISHTGRRHLGTRPKIPRLPPGSNLIQLLDYKHRKTSVCQ